MAWKGWEDYVPPARERSGVDRDGTPRKHGDVSVPVERKPRRSQKADRSDPAVPVRPDAAGGDPKLLRGSAKGKVRFGGRSRIPTAEACYVDPVARLIIEPEHAKAYERAKQEEGGLTEPLQRFQSKREARRYIYLLGEQDAGRIHELRRQVRYPLNVRRPDGVDVTIAHYVADFVYGQVHGLNTFIRGVSQVVEDCKGHRTEMYQRSKKHFEAQYGRKIKET